MDFNGPSNVPSRQSRFAPKNSKLKSQPETKSKSETPPSSDSAIPNKKEELGAHPPLTDHIEKNGVATVEDDVPLNGETTGNDLAEEQVAMETDNDQDEVVREIDVWRTPSLSEVDFS